MAPSADRLTIAKACLNLNQYQRASGHLHKWLAQHPDDAEAQKLLRDAQSHLTGTTLPASMPSTP